MKAINKAMLSALAVAVIGFASPLACSGEEAVPSAQADGQYVSPKYRPADPSLAETPPQVVVVQPEVVIVEEPETGALDDLKSGAIKTGHAIKDGSVRAAGAVKEGAIKTGEAAKRGYGRVVDFFSGDD